MKDSPLHNSTSKQVADTRIVWTLEENTQQKAGIPREFTFVILMERPAVSKMNHHSKRKRSSLFGNDDTFPTALAGTLYSSQSSNYLKEYDEQDKLPLDTDSCGPMATVSSKVRRSKSTRSHALSLGLIDNLRAEASKLTKRMRPQEAVMPASKQTSWVSYKPPVVTTPSISYEEIFADIELSVSVKPDVAGMNIPAGIFEHHAQVTTVKGQVGQKFVSDEHSISEETSNMIPGLYNFTRLPVNFEDLIELPGSTISTIVCAQLCYEIVNSSILIAHRSHL